MDPGISVCILCWLWVMSGAPNFSQVEESERLCLHCPKAWHTWLLHYQTSNYNTAFDLVTKVNLLICCLQYISLYSIVPGILRSCNITLTYNLSTRRLQFINSTWDAMPVSHLHVPCVCSILNALTNCCTTKRALHSMRPSTDSTNKKKWCMTNLQLCCMRRFSLRWLLQSN